MKKQDIIKEGTKVLEKDFYDGFIYLYTRTFYKVGKSLMCIEEHSNANRYTGKNTSYLVNSDYKADRERYNDFWWMEYGLKADDLKEIDEQF